MKYYKKTKTTRCFNALWVMGLAFLTLLSGRTEAQVPSTVFQPSHVTVHHANAAHSVLEGDFEYDANGLLVECLIDNANDSSHVQYTLSYDGNKNLLEYEKKLWGLVRTGRGKRYPYMNKVLYRWEYDADSRVTGIERYWHDGHNDEYWVADGLWKPQYDEEGRLTGDTLLLTAMPDGYSPLLFKWSRQITYTEQERVTLFTHLDGGLITERITEAFDTEGNRLYARKERLDGDDFVNVALTEYGYADCRLTTVDESVWDVSAWRKEKTTRYVRDAQGEIVVTEYLTWENGVSTPYKKTERELDDHGLPLSITFLNYSPEGWTQGSNVAEFPHVSLPGHAVDTFFTAPYLKIHNLFFNYGGISRMELTYNETTEPAYESHEIGHTEIAVSPNPVGEVLNIRYSPDVNPTRVELYDVQGRLVISQESNLKSVSTANLPAGVYSVKVTLSNGKSYSDTVIKK